MHDNSDSSSDFLFPSLRTVGKVLTTLDKPAAYQTFLKDFKLAVKSADINVGLSKVGLHSLRRGGGGSLMLLELGPPILLCKSV